MGTYVMASSERRKKVALLLERNLDVKSLVWCTFSLYLCHYSDVDKMKIMMRFFSVLQNNYKITKYIIAHIYIPFSVFFFYFFFISL